MWGDPGENGWPHMSSACILLMFVIGLVAASLVPGDSPQWSWLGVPVFILTVFLLLAIHAWIELRERRKPRRSKP